ncbi:class I SAM-dependent methyltransferase [Paenibacillus turpanensis]|uniref:class I SAM-dependent methyltransferase n=1 Tax=Paenibacillus turpanensis TaxID=2689078 RepID=UPI00140C63EF|nr:class I SAM-dependent methyltransferase [Paenibacillus turpanensis]
MKPAQTWKPAHYDEKLGFVSAYGKEVVQLLDAKAGEAILDVGCGTGDLAHEIAQNGAVVTGVDQSPEMIKKARSKYATTPFHVMDAHHLDFHETFDAVFSNAALHWMKQPELVIEGVWNSLKSGGRYVAEFGGKGNVETVVSAIVQVLSDDYGIEATQRNPWYFPSIGEYSTLLEKKGFRVVYAVHFDRPSPMEDGEEGIYHWLKGYADCFFLGLSDHEKQAAYERIAQKTKNRLFQDGVWNIDYKRLRIAAVKP